MTINIADNSPRISYAVAQGATQTSFAVPFEFFDNADLNVFVDGTLKTITTHYTVSGGDGSTGTVSISVTGITGGSTVVITRDIALERTTDFPVSGAFNIVALNTELDRIVGIAADLEDKASRALQLTDFDAAVSLVLPTVDTRKGKTLAFNASTGAVEAGPSITDVQTVSAASADIALLANIQDGTTATNAITTVASNNANISTVAGVSGNVTTVAGISANVTTVAGIASNVTTVAGDTTHIQALGPVSGNITTVAGAVTNVNTVATNIASVNSVATNIASVVAVASDLAETVSEIETVANDLAESTSEIDTVATNIANVNAVGNNIANVNTVASNNSNINAVAADATDIGTVASNISNVNAVGGVSANVTTVAGIASDVTAVANIQANISTIAQSAATTNINTVATDISGSNNIGAVAAAITNVNNVGGSIASVNTVATNLSTVTDFFAVYRSGSSDPTTSLDTGDLFYNTTSGTLKVYTGSAWEAGVTAGSGFLPLSGGTLSGNLGLGTNDITTTGKMLYSNVYTALNDLPAAATYHGMFAHVHATGKAYYAHANAWVPLVNEDGSGGVKLGDNWTVTETNGSLYFSTGGTNKMKLDASGNLDVVGSVNSNATIT